ncbi:MAG: 4-hydroxythreonine-4-phosphate dehydrogenase PdxA [Bacteroidales bacterium]|nr:4-hydroxythreonine-4-phosphate dehydrogenase PdxA [Bacteroidales bacterium]MBN2820335.1 4-hydroxythreonine-4-phosphate dehydrogenase PdxA [Bacteroidales bacterium]
MKHDKIVLGITQGDINSISYEVIIKSLMDNRLFDNCIPVVYGSAKVAAYHRKALNIDNFSFNNVRNADEANQKRANIINCIDENIRVELGKPTDIAGEAAIAALEMATDDLINGKIDVLVTGPINKQTAQSDKFKFPGHTEYLQEKFRADDVLMLLINDFFKIGVVTGHIPINEVSKSLSKEGIVSKIEVLNQSLITDFRVRKPRIAVLGLNPHASDNGLIGSEEAEIIMPAIEEAREKNILAFGPFPADGFFGAASYMKFDAVLGMYHDQGLIPFKSMSYDGGVNYTAGMDFIRTSPSHGTAFELAGQNEASPDSFRKAIYAACDIFRARKGFDEITSDPLKSYDISEL